MLQALLLLADAAPQGIDPTGGFLTWITTHGVTGMALVGCYLLVRAVMKLHDEKAELEKTHAAEKSVIDQKWRDLLEKKDTEWRARLEKSETDRRDRIESLEREYREKNEKLLREQVQLVESNNVALAETLAVIKRINASADDEVGGR